MILNPPQFFFFLFSAVIINYFSNANARIPFLTLCSLLFIALFSYSSCIAIIVFSTLNYLFAKKVNTSKAIFIAGISVNVACIILVNYFSFVNATSTFAFAYFDIQKNALALGLSFYTLQNISYLIEVKRNNILPQTNIIHYTLFTSFFPKIISGPILLPADFFPQLWLQKPSHAQLIKGFQRIVYGLAKKMIVANRLAPAVSSVFDYHSQYSGLTYLIGAYLFTIQLYFDFSGYCDIAIGAGNLLGFEVRENFNFPLKATSIGEFWRRWHISLISWFTSYIYYPIVYFFRKQGKISASIGIIITFLLSGIWHGIGITFFLWSLCHTVYLSFELFTKSFRTKLSEIIPKLIYTTASVFIVFNAVCFSNIFFRAHSPEQAFHIIQSLFSFHSFIPVNWLSDLIAPLAVGGHQIDKFNLATSILMLLLFLFTEKKITHLLSKQTLNTAFLLISILLILVFGMFDSGTRFIYMQF